MASLLTVHALCCTQITASMQLREQMGEAQEALTQRSKLQAMVREAHDSLSALQVQAPSLCGC